MTQDDQERSKHSPSDVANEESEDTPVRPDDDSYLRPGGALAGELFRDLQDQLVPEEIGPYRLLERLGRGGMGEVWLAEQREPVQRRVAIKLIKPGMDTRQVVARFEAERRSLALMDHSSIARVLDVGSTRSGHPYFVMELVRGIPVTVFCDEQDLGLRERLELFLRICDGVQHAHQKGVIHRDLKPSNLLVATEDGTAIPKIIDFGIAKAIGPTRYPDQLTRHGDWIGTPEYMSPEQAAQVWDVDIRSDVYSLGLVLYELLAGVLPHGRKSLSRSRPEDVRRRILTAETPPPSSHTETTAANSRQLRGDLDWIVLKALERDRNRRYATVAELAADVRRHLADEPVLAGPPGVGYRLLKLVRRHRTAAVMGAILASGTLVAIVGVTLGLVRAVQAERRTQDEARVAEEVSDFLVELFQVSDPGESRGDEVTARELLDRGAERIDGELSERPAVRARLMQTMGRAYQGLGLFPQAVDLFQAGNTIQREHFGEGSSEHLVSLSRLIDARRLTGDYEQAGELAQRRLEMLEARDGEGSLELAEALSQLGILHWHRGEFSAARETLGRSLQIKEELLGVNDPSLPPTLNNVAILHWQDGRSDLAIPLFERALDIWIAELGEDHPDVAGNLNNLAIAHDALDHHDEARRYHERALAVREKILEPDHPDLAESLNNLGNLLRKTGAPSAARESLERALAIREQAFPKDHPLIATSRLNLGLTLLDLGQLDSAGASLHHALASFERSLGPDHADLAHALVGVARLEVKRERPGEARRYFVRALDLREQQLGPDHRLAEETRRELARLDTSEGSPR